MGIMKASRGGSCLEKASAGGQVGAASSSACWHFWRPRGFKECYHSSFIKLHSEDLWILISF